MIPCKAREYVKQGFLADTLPELKGKVKQGYIAQLRPGAQYAGRMARPGKA